MQIFTGKFWKNFENFGKYIKKYIKKCTYIMYIYVHVVCISICICCTYKYRP